MISDNITQQETKEKIAYPHFVQKVSSMPSERLADITFEDTYGLFANTRPSGSMDGSRDEVRVGRAVITENEVTSLWRLGVS